MKLIVDLMGACATTHIDRDGKMTVKAERLGVWFKDMNLDGVSALYAPYNGGRFGFILKMIDGWEVSIEQAYGKKDMIFRRFRRDEDGNPRDYQFISKALYWKDVDREDPYKTPKDALRLKIF